MLQEPYSTQNTLGYTARCKIWKERRGGKKRGKDGRGGDGMGRNRKRGCKGRKETEGNLTGTVILASISPVNLDITSDLTHRSALGRYHSSPGLEKRAE